MQHSQPVRAPPAAVRKVESLPLLASMHERLLQEMTSTLGLSSLLWAEASPSHSDEAPKIVLKVFIFLFEDERGWNRLVMFTPRHHRHILYVQLHRLRGRV